MFQAVHLTSSLPFTSQRRLRHQPGAVLVVPCSVTVHKHQRQPRHQLASTSSRSTHTITCSAVTTNPAVGNKGSSRAFRKRDICIAVDGTQGSVQAMQWALDNLLSPTDVVHLAHVISDPRAPQTAVGSTGAGVQWSPPATAGADSPQLAQEWRKRLMEQGTQLLLNTFVPMLRAAGISNEVEVLQQRGAKSAAGIGELLCNKAAALKADLLVVASHGSGVLAEYGSVAQYCTKHTPCPLLLLPPLPLTTLSPGQATADVVVAAWDDLAGLEQATRLTVDLLHCKGQKLKLALMSAHGDDTDDDNGKAKVSDASKQLLAAASSWAPATTVTCEVTPNISVSEPDSEHSLMGERICRDAAHSGAKLVVLKAIGSSLVRELVHGPAQSYVLRHSQLPLVLVP